ncbi:MAG: DNA primase [Bacteroidetes bacterium]|nr:DNA primase [Bacteroidota bacterium]
MRIPNHIVDQVRDTADILSIVQDYVRLKQVGNNYIGLCPFHEEKTPSFNVNPAKGYYKCFGCGKGGNVFNFVMEIERLLFVDAVRWLAERVGITIPTQVGDREDYDKKEIVFHALRFAAKYYAEQLLHPHFGLHAIEYLRGRGLTDQTIERFKLGYAPNAWDGLLKAAARESISPETLVRAGLIKKRDDSQGYYDRLRNRVIFPITSHVGRIIGFGGRVFTPDDKAPKYINSPDTEIYHKSNVLYGLYQAKHEARKEDRVLLVEGYTDVLALYQAGFGAVACCGTALTPSQVKLMGRYVNEIRLLYDADSAGQTANERAIDHVLQNGLDASVVSLPEGEDPDSFVLGHGAETFRDYLQRESKDWMESMVAKAMSNHLLDSPRGKREEIAKVAKRISWVQDDLLRKLYIQKASGLFGIHEGDIAQEVIAQARGRQAKTPQAVAPPPENSSIVEEIPVEQKLLLKVMIDYGGSMIKFIMGYTGIHEFKEGACRELANALVKIYEEYQDQSLKVIQDGHFEVSETAQQLMATLMIEQHHVSPRWSDLKVTVPPLHEDVQRVAEESMLVMKRKSNHKNIRELERQILSAQDGSEKQMKLQQEYAKMREKRIKLQDRGIFYAGE